MKRTQTVSQIGPQDPRHGTTKGYHQGCGCRPCLDAMALYERRRRKTSELYGRGYSVPAQGAKRRLEALMAIGWTAEQISNKCGWQNRNAVHAIRNRNWIERATHEVVRNVYEQLCMTIPEGPTANRQRLLGRSRGWIVPLAWENIDTDQTPATSPTTSLTSSSAEIDVVRVERVLNGRRTKCSRAEQYAVLDAWKGSLAELERVSGWNIYRLLDDRKLAA